MSGRRGFFITLEGPEGSGKSTQARWLLQGLRRRGRRVVFVRDPGSTALGRALRRVLVGSDEPLSPMTEAALFIGGRVALVEEKIAPALRQGRVVVCDRFHDATVVYQGYAGGIDVSWLDRWGRQAISGVMPDLTLLLDVPVGVGFGRLRRSRDRMERKARQFHQRVRRGYLAWACRHPRRLVVIDAARRMSAVQNDIQRTISSRLKLD